VTRLLAEYSSFLWYHLADLGHILIIAK